MKFDDGFDGRDKSISMMAAAYGDADDDFDISINDEEDDEEEIEVLTSSDDDDDADQGDDAVDELMPHDSHAEEAVIADVLPSPIGRYEPADRLSQKPTRNRAQVSEGASIKAASLIVSAGRDDTSILIVLTARSLAPKLPISVTIQAEDNEDIAARAGATTVINPISVSATLLAERTRSPTIV